MIKINKFENIFGIKQLRGADSLGKLNVIYAPNGTAKSSISDALENISSKESVDDVYGSGSIPSYEIDVNGNICDENNFIPFNIIKYCGVEEFKLEDGGDYQGIVISPKMANKVSTIQKNIKQSVSTIANILQACFSTKGKGRGGDLFSKPLREAIEIVAKTAENDDALLIGFANNLQTSIKPLSTAIDENAFYKLVNVKAVDTATKPEVKQHLNEYALIVNKKIASNVLDNDFKIDNLNSFSNHIKEDKYFDAANKRKLFINNKEIGSAEFEKIVKEQNDLIYGDDETKRQYEECKSVLTKNKATNDLANILLSDPVLLSHASNYAEFINELFVTIIDAASLKLLEVEKAKISIEQAKLESMKSSIDDNDNALSKIWSNFESRFAFDKFDLKIRNRFDAVIGFDVPHFIKCIKGTDVEIDDPSELRFSTGEIRTFNLINAIIEIERARLSNQEVTIVLDDAVDSFDYKNKYGIINYLLELKDNPKIQIIIFTHNFDFYRSSILAFGKGNTNQYFMYKDSGGVVTLFDSRNKKYYLEVGKFNDWKHSPTNAQYFSLVPFFRNVLQLESNSSNPDVKILDSYLHYDDTLSTSQDLSSLNTVLSARGCNLPSGMSSSDKYLQDIDNEISRILSSAIHETDLEEKLVLGIYIRLFSERLLCKKIISSGYSLPPVNPYNKTKELMNFAIANNCLDSDEISLLLEASVIAPSYVHANSFMYEPLIDVDSKTLVRITSRLKSLNLTWAL